MDVVDASEPLSVSPSSRPVASSVVRRHLAALELPEVLLVSEVAQVLRVSSSTVYELCDRGELPFVRVSGAIRIHREALKAFIRKRR